MGDRNQFRLFGPALPPPEWADPRPPARPIDPDWLRLHDAHQDGLFEDSPATADSAGQACDAAAEPTEVGSSTPAVRRHGSWVPLAGEFAAHRDQLREPLSEATVADQVRAFRPTDLPAEAWEAIGPFVREVVSKATQGEPPSSRLTVLTQLANWSWTGGTPMAAAEVLHPDQVDAFIAQGCTHLAEGTRANYRSLLRGVGEAVVGPPLYPGRPLPLASSERSAPYSPRDVRDLVGWAHGLSTHNKRHNVGVVLSCALGAGLSAQDINLLTGTDVTVTSDGVAIDVPGERQRRVWVAARWERAITEQADLVGERPMFRPDRTTPLAKGVTNYIDGLPQGLGAPRLTIQRCRTTWIVDHLTNDVPLDVLAAAAGVDPSALASYAPFLPPTPDHVVKAMLRGQP
jgi:hypothetical protein